MRIIYIAGIGRSGSTLLERVLGELPDVCALGEVHNLWHRAAHTYGRCGCGVLLTDERCGCGSPLSRCDFWTAVVEKAFGGWRNLDLQRVLAMQRAVERIRNLPWLIRSRMTGDRLAAVTEYTSYYARVYEAAAAVSGSRVVIDSSKSPGLALCLRWTGDVDIRVVHLVRDPRGVAHSWTKHVARPEADGAGLLRRSSPVASAISWNTYNLAMSILKYARGANSEMRVSRIRYEDFVAAPESSVRSIARFAGLEGTATDLSYLHNDYADLGAIHSISGNPMRFAVGQVPLHHDDAWQAGLPARQRRIVSAICAPLLAAYRYPVITQRSADRAGRRCS